MGFRYILNPPRNVLLNNCKHNNTSLSLLVGTTVVHKHKVGCSLFSISLIYVNDDIECE